MVGGKENRPREQLAALYEIGRALNSTLEPDEVLDLILGMTLDLFQADAGSIMLIQDDHLRIRRARGLSPEVVEKTRVPLGQGIAGWVAQTGEMLLLNGRIEDPRFSNLVPRQDEISSSLCTPLRSRKGVIGVMMVRRAGTKRFSRSQLDFFASVADQASLALENARLFQSEQERSRQLALEQQKFRAIFRDMADGVLVVDHGGGVTHINDAARRLLGLHQEKIGIPLSDLLPHLPLHVVRQAASGPGEVFEADIKLPSSAGNTVLRVTATSLEAEPVAPEGLVLLLHDVTERVRVERMKSEFLSAISHELKTPLTTVSGFLELMLNREYDRSRQEQYLSISLAEAQRLQRLIEDLLTLSRLESGQFRLQPVPVFFDQLAASVLAGFSERYPGFHFELRVEGELPPLEADGDLLIQVLVNLVSNSVKYSPDGGDVRVLVRGEPQGIRVSVEDQGIGIPRDKIPFVFDRFYRVDNSLTRRTGGTGLGLANARYIVEGHGGTIWAESPVEKGSRFTFVLPCKRNEVGESEA
jgi:PAS domain S-box-containing protein